jgi:hypothetical protein
VVVATLGVSRMRRTLLTGRIISVYLAGNLNENRFVFDKPRFDSWRRGRLSFNPSKTGHYTGCLMLIIKSPEALHADENVNRATASAQYALPLNNDILI